MPARVPDGPPPRRPTLGANAARFAHGSSAPANRMDANSTRVIGFDDYLTDLQFFSPSSLATADRGASGAIIPQAASSSSRSICRI